MRPLGVILAGLGALAFMKNAGAESAPSRIRQVTVEGRGYTIMAFDNGDFQVRSNADPDVWLTFNRTEVLDHGDHGSPDKLIQLRADLDHFPKEKELFG